MRRRRAFRTSVVAVLLGLVCLPVAAEEPAVDPKWVRVETPHFTVWSDAPAAKTLSIVGELERFRAVLVAMMPREAKQRWSKIPIYVFASNAGFVSYNRPNLTGDVEGFAGFFRDTRFGPVIALSVDSRNLYRKTIYHEAVHGFLRRGAALPLWLEEGIAEYLSSTALLDDGARVGLVLEHHVKEIRLENWAPLRWTLGMSGTSPTYNDADRVGPFYAYAWLVVHYLLEGREPPMTVQQLLDGVRLGGSPDGSGLIRGLDAKLRPYVKRRDLPSSVVEVPAGVPTEELEQQAVGRAEILERLGELQAYAHFRLPEAEALFREALQLAPESRDAAIGLSYVLERTQRPEEAASLWKKATAAAPPDQREMQIRAWGILESIEPSVLTTGSGAQFSARLVEARQLLERCVELDPSSGVAWYGLGMTYNYDVVDIAPGVAAHEKARDLLNGAPDVEANLAILYARAGRTEESRALLAALAARGVDSRMTVEIERAMVDAQNETIRVLAQKGEHHTAIELVTALLAETKDPNSRAALERKIEWLTEDAKVRALYDAYNRAVNLSNERRFAEAYEILDELVKTVDDPRLKPAIDDLHDRIGEMLGKTAPPQD